MDNETKNLRKKYHLKSIKVSLKDGDDTKVKTEFHGGAFTAQEFTSLFMGVLEAYTVQLLETNTKEAVYDHFNSVFGIFLHKILPTKEIYTRDKAHAALKELSDSTLGKAETPELSKLKEDNRMAAYLLARDILTEDAHMSEESVDVLLNKRMKGLNNPANRHKPE